MKLKSDIQKSDQPSRKPNSRPVKFNTTVQKRSIGVNFNEKGADVWVWATNSKTVELAINGGQNSSLTKQAYGYWYIFTKQLQPGDRYEFILDGDKTLPDPASLS